MIADLFDVRLVRLVELAAAFAEIGFDPKRGQLSIDHREEELVVQGERPGRGCAVAVTGHGWTVWLISSDCDYGPGAEFTPDEVSAVVAMVVSWLAT